VTTALTTVRRPLTLQPAPTSYAGDESAVATARGILPRDIMLLGGTGSRFNASPDSVLVADFRPNSAVVRTSAREELASSWTAILEGNTTREYALLGFTDAAGEEAGNQQLRADRAHALAALLPGVARRGVVGAAPAGDFVRPANASREDRALNRAVLLRLPPDELRQPAEIEAYSGDAVTFWRGNPTKTVDDLVTFLSGRVTDLLTGNGIPEPQVIKGSAAKGTSVLAFFDAAAWTITVDMSAVTADTKQTGITGASRLADLDVDTVARLSNTCYHEARHAEQDFLSARAAAEDAGDSADATTLASSLGIRKDIAEQAITASAVVLPDVIREKTKGWRAFGPGGRFITYRMWNEGLMLSLQIFAHTFSSDVIRKWTKKDAGAIRKLWPKLHDFIDKTFRHDYSYRENAVRRDLYANPHPDALDTEVRKSFDTTAGKLFMMLAEESGLGKIPDDKALAALDAAHRRVAERQAKSWLMNLFVAMLDTKITAEDAYHAYPHEADAYQVGEAVTESVARHGTP
jgi:outer membrane protein OmpA-like peptidoglycan-associated protein